MIVNLLEIFHIVFLCHLFLLPYFLCVGAYVFSSSSWPPWRKIEIYYWYQLIPGIWLSSCVAACRKLLDNQSMPYTNSFSCVYILVILLLKLTANLCILLILCSTLYALLASDFHHPYIFLRTLEYHYYYYYLIAANLFVVLEVPNTSPLVITNMCEFFTGEKYVPSVSYMVIISSL